MSVKKTIIFILFFSFLFGKAEAEPLYPTVSDREAKLILTQLSSLPEKKTKADLLLDLSNYFLARTDRTSSDLDSASLYFKKALELSKKLAYRKGILTSELFQGIYWYFTDADQAAMTIYKSIIVKAKKEKLHDLEGRTWYQIAIMQDPKGRLESYQKAIDSYRAAGDKWRIKYIVGLTEKSKILTSSNQYFPGYIPISPAFIPATRSQLASTKSDKTKLDLLLKLASIYIYRNGQEKIHLDSAVLLLNQAEILARKIKDRHSINESILLRGGVYQEKREIANVHRLIRVLTDTSKIKLLNNLSDHYWYTAFKTPPKTNMNYVDSSYYLNREALNLSLALKNREYSKQSMERLMRVTDYKKQFTSENPEKSYAFISQNAAAAGYPSKIKLYGIYSSDYNNRGNFYKALYYAHLMESELKKGKINDDDLLSVYVNLLLFYKRQDNCEKSTYFHLKIIDNSKIFNTKILVYAIINSYVECLIAMKKPYEALDYLKEISKKKPPEGVQANVYYNVALGHIYKALNNFDMAEKHYKEAIKYRERQRANANSLYNDLASLYVSKKMFKEANEVFRNADVQIRTNQAPTLVPYFNLKSQIDSANGNYKSAYNLLSISKQLSDSVYIISKNRLTQELEFQYQTQKKEIDLRLKDENIRFLNQRAELLRQTSTAQQSRLSQAELLAQKNLADLKLKQKDIDLLNQNAKLQKSNLQKQQFQRKVAIGAAGMFLLLTLLLYRLYYNKRTNNKKLEVQQMKIEQSNAKLRTILEEKEWLLKEIHHRVKNNLHTVMSLLESQSAYLENDALEAIKNSKHRIFAMSLIHQKLYLSDEVKAINMANYIPELVEYLKESFDVRRNVCFNINVDSVEFDVAEAVPLGLIVNEVITNSLKYAFDPGVTGNIGISLRETEHDVYELIIEDDGIGLPMDFELHSVKSLGLKLIKGLTAQLEANLSIENDGGTRVKVSSLSNNYFSTIKFMENEEGMEV